jgi:S-DNA-T family DNA segregation ATPase FtsK/SpoIIIE
MDEDLKKKIKNLSKRVEKLESFFANIQDFKIEEINLEEEDDLYVEVLGYVMRQNMVSSSFLQRKFGIGFNHVARLMEQLERDGVIEKGEGIKPRKVLINSRDASDNIEEKKKPN